MSGLHHEAEVLLHQLEHLLGEMPFDGFDGVTTLRQMHQRMLDSIKQSVAVHREYVSEVEQ